jgi:hypothetical protein
METYHRYRRLIRLTAVLIGLLVAPKRKLSPGAFAATTTDLAQK